MNNNKRWQVIQEAYDTYIRDTVNNTNFCVLCEGMMGVKSKAIEIARKICDYLNAEDIEFKP